MPHERSQAKKNIYCEIYLYKILENIEQGWKREREAGIIKGHKETFWGGKEAHYLNCDDSWVH